MQHWCVQSDIKFKMKEPKSRIALNTNYISTFFKPKEASSGKGITRWLISIQFVSFFSLIVQASTSQ